ncbi:MAG: nucleotidyltransferase family protein [Burkholderiaceae bacterium]
MPVGVLLAAGLGTRYDPSGNVFKLLQPAPDGIPIVVAAARNLRSAVERVVAVVRPRGESHQSQLHDLLRQEHCELAVCERASEGIGVSLACGVRASEDADGWIVALGDMPQIGPATIAAVARALADGHTAAAPVYRGQRGHPVGFASRCLEDLLHSAGDQGARSVLEKFPPQLIEVDDPGILVDIDQPLRDEVNDDRR